MPIPEPPSDPVRRAGLPPRLLGLLVALAALAGAVTACSPGYVLRAGWEEARILAAREPIDRALRDTAAPAELRAKLRLVRHARDFAERSLGLDPGDSFRSFARLERDTLLLVVSAAPEFALRWKTWWFPIVGRVPYRGYFDFDRARGAADALRREGYDVSLRPASAFSTLGWLPDPLLSTTLRLDSLSLVETVIHEIVHTTYYPAGQARFNESFASFVGHRGAIEFFCRAVADAEACRRAEARWSDARVFGRFFESMVPPLRELYASDLGDEEKRTRKRALFRQAVDRFEAEVRPALHGGRYRLPEPDRLDNAWVLARLLYYSRLDDFEAVHAARGDLRETIRAVIETGRRHGPWEGLDALLTAREDRASG